jgi:hypothetical protein
MISKENEAELKRIFEEEREKLGITSNKIEIIFLDPPPIEYYESFSQWWNSFDKFSTGVIKEDGVYKIQFNPLSFKTPQRFRRVARHELYHIYKDLKNPKEKTSFLSYLFIEEPCAMLYQFFRLKL